MTPTVESLLTSAQRILGIQQAQTLVSDNIAADVVARLTETRGNIRRILELWPTASAAGPELVDGWRADEHAEPLATLQRMLDASLVTARKSNGNPRALRPLAPVLVTKDGPNTVFRAVGVSVVEGLWAGEPELKRQLAERVRSWQTRHPLADLLARLCAPAPLERHGSACHLADLFNGAEQPELTTWRTEVVLDDWRHWLPATNGLAPDEQLEMFATLIGVHLHLALVKRLARVTNGPGPFVFASVGHGASPSCRRAATGFLAFWRDRVGETLRVCASSEVARLAGADAALAKGLAGAEWTDLVQWTTDACLQFDRSTKKPATLFRTALTSAIAARRGKPCGAGEARQLLIDTLADAFSGTSSSADKLKGYHRVTGSAGGLIGPDDRGSRKRYLLEDRAIEVLARLHVARHGDARSEDDPASLEAFLDGLFERYGIVVTTERPAVREALQKFGPLQRVLPDPAACRQNREQLERRLDALRLLRRFSDASTVIHVAE